ncbi:MAG: saccharopine dehydrogenase NADP-binding domain-containing protein [Pseudomonadota bacterium]
MTHEGPLEVLLLGASGVFGSRLARLACEEDGIHLTLAARGLAKVETLAAEMPGDQACVALNRDTLTAHDLAGFDVVVDAAGPFQSSHSRVIESAIAARTDYIDLADGREFVRNFPRYDEVAKGAEVALTTGASSIPALSHAVLDNLTRNWRSIESIRIGIYPGNRAPRGLSVVEAILSYVGHPVRVFMDGEWQKVPGWGFTHREDLPGIGKRWAGVCDTPEQDLLVERYKPTKSAEFYAGLELSILHLGLAALALPVRWGWVKSMRSIARPMLAAAQWFLPFGSDRGGMSVRVKGADGDGRLADRRWFLNADANRGPNVPTLAALAMLRRYRDGERPAPGARVCSGMLTLDDFSADFSRLGIMQQTYDEKLAPIAVREASALAPRGEAWQ